MAWIALAVSVILNAALAAVFLVFYRRVLGRVIALESFTPYRYATPDEPASASIFRAVVPAMHTDIVGAWAEEQERRGVSVSDEEMDVQRRMWAAEA